jgi:hypothetical protein
MTIRDKIRAVHADHPNWTAKMVGEQLGVSDAYVRAVAGQIGLRLPSGRGAGKRTLAQRICVHLEAHPKATSSELARLLNVPTKAVLDAAYKAKIRLEPVPLDERIAKTTGARRTPGGHGSSSAATATSKAAPRFRPTRTREPTFVVRDDAGRYVHQELLTDANGKPAMTSNRAYAWLPTRRNLAVVSQRFPSIAAMRLEAANG